MTNLAAIGQHLQSRDDLHDFEGHEVVVSGGHRERDAFAVVVEDTHSVGGGVFNTGGGMCLTREMGVVFNTGGGDV